MRRLNIEFALLALFTFHLSLFTASCSEEEEPYPNVTTEMADLYVSSTGSMSRIVLDNDKGYTISNPQSGYKANAVYRTLVGFIATDSMAELYSVTGVRILRDTFSIAKKDPTKVLSAWRTKRYVNLHLAPLTQGGNQLWGFITDSVKSSTASNGFIMHHAYLSLYHNQGSDPTSYTTDVYASLPIDSIKVSSLSGKSMKISQQDTITLRIKTFDGEKTFNL